jgi:ferredoxin
MSRSWRVDVARDRCLGTGACVFAAPGVFALGADGIVTVISDVDDGDDVAKDAVAECPTGALSLVAIEN